MLSSVTAAIALPFSIANHAACMQRLRSSHNAITDEPRSTMAVSLLWASIALVCATFAFLGSSAATQNVGFDYLLLGERELSKFPSPALSGHS